MIRRTRRDGRASDRPALVITLATANIEMPFDLAIVGVAAETEADREALA